MEATVMKRCISTRLGVTLTELLVVMVIIAILTTIAVPVYLNKAENARINTAKADVRQLAEAEDSCAIAHGFYVPLQVLNDLPANLNRTASPSGSLPDLIYPSETNRYLIDPSMTIDEVLNNTLTIRRDQNSQAVGGSTTTDARVTKMIDEWQGPFLNFHRYGRLTSSSTILEFNGPQEHPDNYPIDPWGNPYLFYVPQGVLNIYSGSASIDTRFMRYAIVSAGPNGKITNLIDQQDDIVYVFGAPHETVNP
jgi:prepilin-type N-terminal cleavage/methylation domain-containing protein